MPWEGNDNILALFKGLFLHSSILQWCEKSFHCLLYFNWKSLCSKFAQNLFFWSVNFPISSTVEIWISLNIYKEGKIQMYHRISLYLTTDIMTYIKKDSLSLKNDVTPYNRQMMKCLN